MHFIILLDNQTPTPSNSALNWRSAHTAIVKVKPLFAEVSPMPLFQVSVDEDTDGLAFFTKHSQLVPLIAANKLGTMEGALFCWLMLM